MSALIQTFSEDSMTAKRFSRARCSVKISLSNDAMEGGLKRSVVMLD